MKRTLPAAVIAALMLLLSACGSDDKSDPPDPTPAVDDADPTDEGDDRAPEDDGTQGTDAESDDAPAASGSTGLAEVHAQMIAAGIPCDGEIDGDVTDSGIEPEPVEIFDCSQDNGLAIDDIPTTRACD